MIRVVHESSTRDGDTGSEDDISFARCSNFISLSLK